MSRPPPFPPGWIGPPALPPHRLACPRAPRLPAGGTRPPPSSPALQASQHPAAAPPRHGDRLPERDRRQRRGVHDHVGAAARGLEHPRDRVLPPDVDGENG